MAETVVLIPLTVVGLGIPVVSLTLLILIYRKVTHLEALLGASHRPS